MQQAYEWSVGIDLGSRQHQVCILDAQGKPRREGIVAHKGEDMAKFIAQLLEVSNHRPETVAISIETPRGSIVEMLKAHGFALKTINPKQLDRFRDRYTVAGAKDDRRDAFALASSWRTDPGAFRPCPKEHDVIVELRELTRTQEELREDLTRMVNQWHGLLRNYYPQFLEVCPNLEAKWAWALWEMAPTPNAAATLTEEAVAGLLKRFRVRRIKAPALLECLQASAFKLSAGMLRAQQQHVELLLPRLKVTHEQWERCEKLVEKLLADLPDEPGATWAQDLAVMRSVPGIGVGVASALLCEATEAIQHRDYRALRSLVGVAPVTRQSGKRRQVAMRRGCSNRLRNTIYHWMRTYTVQDDYGKAYYRALREKGHSHGRAIRAVADRLLCTLTAMLRDGNPYDPRRRVLVQTANSAG